MAALKRFFQQPFDIQWRTAFVRMPRAVPDVILRFTIPEGPQPFVLQCPSRGKYKIPVYVFVPPDLDASKAKDLPVVVDFHGGGFVLGSCLEQAPFCAMLSRELGAIILSVDYRMGPIDKFPAAIEDGEDILDSILNPNARGYTELRKAIASKIPGASTSTADLDSLLSKTRIALSGFSSGGNLALNLALSISPPHHPEPWPSRIPQNHPCNFPLLLFYPSLDSRLLPSQRTRPAAVPGSDTSFWETVFDTLGPTYLPREQAAHPRASPGLAPLPQSLHEKVRILLVLPELDNLAEQSDIWIKEVQDNGRGKDLRIERYKGQRHGWTQMPVSWLDDEAKRTRQDSYEKAVRFVKDVWAGGSGQ